MNYIIAGLIGIVVWQIIGLIVYEASGEKEEILAWVVFLFLLLSVTDWAISIINFILRGARTT